MRARERVILTLFAEGLTTAKVAELLVISEHTVRTHVKLAMRRLGVKTRADAVAIVRAGETALLP
jgi:DNA-binding CsgD family transcriptional regulator